MNNVNKKFSTTKLVAGLLACTITAGTAAALGSGLSVFAGTAGSEAATYSLTDNGNYEYTYRRAGDYKIDDVGPFDQSYDVFPWDLLPSYTQLIDEGYRYVTVTIKMQMKEKNKGYQQVFLYPSEGGSYNDFRQRIEVEYGGDKLVTSYGEVTFYFKSVSLSEYLTNNTLCTVVRYGATGGGEDTWYNKDMNMTVQVSKDIIKSDNTASGNVKVNYGYNNP